MKNITKQLTGLTMMAFLFFAGCGGGEGESNQASSEASAQTESTGLSDFEQKHGIGPVTEVVTIGEIDMKKVEKGKEIFRTKCAACHKMNEDYVGPALGEVFEKRTPTYVMNMILNPVEMTKKHPEARKMLAQYMNQMTFQNVSNEEARAIVEYLASVQSDNQNEQNN